MAKRPSHENRNRKKSTHKGVKSAHKPAAKPAFKKAKPKRVAIDKQVKDPNAGMRLNKYMANSGVCSRRDADIYIASGNVTVNGKVVTEMGFKVKLTDEVKFDGRRLNPEKKEYILLNKPAGFYVTGKIEANNRTVMDLVSGASKSRITPVGKMETSAKGLLFFTNDGTLKKRLARVGIRQIFQVELTRNLKNEDLATLREGIYLKDTLIKPRAVDYVEGKTKRHIGIEITSTQPKVVPKLFKKIGYEIKDLDRMTYGELTKKNLSRGRYRYLTKQEIINLGML